MLRRFCAFCQRLWAAHPLDGLALLRKAPHGGGMSCSGVGMSGAGDLEAAAVKIEPNLKARVARPRLLACLKLNAPTHRIDAPESGPI